MSYAEQIKARNERIAAIAATVKRPSRAVLMAQADAAAKSIASRNERLRAILRG